MGDSKVNSISIRIPVKLLILTPIPISVCLKGFSIVSNQILIPITKVISVILERNRNRPSLVEKNFMQQVIRIYKAHHFDFSNLSKLFPLKPQVD